MTASRDPFRGSVVPVVLSLLGAQPMYGYEMVRLVNARTNGVLEWKEGTLYPTLHQLEADGLLKAEWRDVKTAAGETGDRQRKYYALTRAGRAELKKRTKEWRAFAAAVDGLLSPLAWLAAGAARVDPIPRPSPAPKPSSTGRWHGRGSTITRPS